MIKSISKRFVIDTNVLIHDPACLAKFEDNEIIILPEVVGELDKFKTEDSPRGRAARKANHALAEFFDSCDDITRGCKTRSGGILRTLVLGPVDGPKTKSILTEDNVDHRLIRALEFLESQGSGPVILVTKDNNLRIKARALGYKAQDYQNDKVHTEELPLSVFDISEGQWRKLRADHSLRIPDVSKMARLNQWVEVRTQDESAWVLRTNDDNVRLPCSPTILDIPGGTTYKPRCEEQRLFLDILLDDRIPLVTAEGMAGTGKTMTALAAALTMALKAGRYDRIIISRPVIGLSNQDVGFLPGTLEEKMEPWMKGYYDNLEQLLTPRDTRHDRKKGDGYRNRQQPKQPPGVNAQATVSVVDRLIQSGRIEIQSLHTIRGRSLRNAFVIVDEAQNTKPLDIKTIITRIGENSKLALLGDTSQIDDPFLDSYSNGLAFTRERLKDERLCAHMTLTQVQRSELAELAATKL